MGMIATRSSTTKRKAGQSNLDTDNRPQSKKRISSGKDNDNAFDVPMTKAAKVNRNVPLSPRHSPIINRRKRITTIVEVVIEKKSGSQGTSHPSKKSKGCPSSDTVSAGAMKSYIESDQRDQVKGTDLTTLSQLAEGERVDITQPDPMISIPVSQSSSDLIVARKNSWLGLLIAQAGDYRGTAHMQHRTIADVSSTLFYAGYKDYKIWPVKGHNDRFIVSFTKRMLDDGDVRLIKRPELVHLKCNNIPFESLLLQEYESKMGFADEQIEWDKKAWVATPELVLEALCEVESTLMDKEATSGQRRDQFDDDSQFIPAMTTIPSVSFENIEKVAVNSTLNQFYSIPTLEFKSAFKTNSQSDPINDRRFALLSKSSSLASWSSAEKRNILEEQYYFLIRAIRHQREGSRTSCCNKFELIWALDQIGVIVELANIIRVDRYSSDYIIKVDKDYVDKMPKASYPVIEPSDTLSKAKIGHPLPNLLVERLSWKHRDDTTLLSRLSDASSIDLPTLLKRNQHHPYNTIESVSNLFHDCLADVQIDWSKVCIDKYKITSKITTDCSVDVDDPEDDNKVVCRVYRCDTCGGESHRCWKGIGAPLCRYRSFEKF